MCIKRCSCLNDLKHWKYVYYGYFCIVQFRKNETATRFFSSYNVYLLVKLANKISDIKQCTPCTVNHSVKVDVYQSKKPAEIVTKVSFSFIFTKQLYRDSAEESHVRCKNYEDPTFLFNCSLVYRPMK